MLTAYCLLPAAYYPMRITIHKPSENPSQYARQFGDEVLPGWLGAIAVAGKPPKPCIVYVRQIVMLDEDKLYEGIEEPIEDVVLAECQDVTLADGSKPAIVEADFSQRLSDLVEDEVRRRLAIILKPSSN